MRLELLCPACGACNFDFDDYESVVLLTPNLALMQFSCSRCKIHLSATVKLDAEMQHIIKQRLAKQQQLTGEDRADLCQTKERISYSSNIIVNSYAMEYGAPRTLKTAGSELKEELESFKNQLDDIETVEQAIKEIDSYYPIQEQRKKRDV